MRAAGLATLLAYLFLSFSGVARADTRLVMLQEAGCGWCERWNAEVGEIYPRTIEGKRAPLLRTDIHEPLPDGIVLQSRARFTPTFVLVHDGHEVGRIEGYPGEDFFWGLLNRLMERLPAEPDPTTGSADDRATPSGGASG